MVAPPVRKNISISLPQELAQAVDEWAASEGTTRSAILVQLIREEQERRFEADLARDYMGATADGYFDDVDLFFELQAEAVLGDAP